MKLKGRPSLRDRLGPLGRWQSGATRRLVLGLAFLGVTTLLLASGFSPAAVAVRLGQPTQEAIKAPRDFIDRPATRKLQEEAMAKVQDVYTLDEGVASQVLRQVTGVLDTVEKVRQGNGTLEEKVTALRGALPTDPGDLTARTLLEMSDSEWSAFRQDLLSLVQHQMDQGIHPESLDTFRRDASATIITWPNPRPALSFATDVVNAYLRPNVLVDEAKTQAARQEAKDAVKPVVIVKGQTIVPDGHVITEEDLERLKDAGLLEGGRGAGVWLAALLVALLLEVLVALYIYHFQPALWQSLRRLTLLALIVGAILLAIWAVRGVSGYLAPVPWAGMMAAILLGPEVALLAVLYEGLAAGLLFDHDVRFAFVGILAGFAAVYSVRRVDQRGAVTRGGVMAALAAMGAILGLELVAGKEAFLNPLFWRDMALGAGMGLASGILTLGSVPFLENSFGILTNLRLLEFSDPNHPLLRRLLLEAPGTYHHSLMVANLAEAGTEAIGGNALLARVGAYYHDVGKLRRPYFFVDNQFQGINPHENLAPSLSARIIINHVKDGVELAREYHLPEEIIAFIRQHHGTMRVGYFYQKAKEAQEGEVEEELFRYPGPRPRTKETAVVMLGDGVEASVRSLKDPTPEKMEQQVRRIIKERLEEGQLDEADITLRDLDVLARSFTRILMGMHHQRVPYPSQIEEELKGASPKGG
ncbi:MAG: HDIG domain-containing protein [Bacillota bacterium]|nr:HDIG domain-containing protein [Bacillota bacterium]